MTEAEVRAELIRELTGVIQRLPNGLLHRLLDDAQFFEAWNMRKRGARAGARMAQHRAHVAQLEERYWQRINRPGASRVR